MTPYYRILRLLKVSWHLLTILAEKLVRPLQDEKSRKNMGEAWRKFVAKFDWDVIVGHTFEVYQETIESK